MSIARDTRLEPLPGISNTMVHSSAHHLEVLLEEADAADFSLVIAPEIDGVLRLLTSELRSCRAVLLAPSDEFISITSNKHTTAQHLHAADVLVPEAILLPADAERLPADFTYPAVLKPLDGAGSQHVLLVEGPGDEPPPYPWPRRLERLCLGTPASVACLTGPGVLHILKPCLQRLSTDGRFTYHGGEIIRDRMLMQRALTLAKSAMEVLPPAASFVGIDMVLGPAEDGSEDAVIEVNPRLTTSYVGLRRAASCNLAQCLLKAFQGEDVRVDYHDHGVEFFADGLVNVV